MTLLRDQDGGTEFDSYRDSYRARKVANFGGRERSKKGRFVFRIGAPRTVADALSRVCKQLAVGSNPSAGSFLCHLTLSS
jgi:hypothetical protein